MASNIKGITIEIGGNTTKLETALKNVNKQVYSLNGDLKNLNQALKLDPKNTELLAQKQDVLKRNIEETTKKLNTLKEAQKQMGSYSKLTDEQKKSYNALSLEIAKSENALEKMNKELKSTNSIRLNTITDALKGLGDVAKKVGQIALDVAKKMAQAFMAVGTAIAGALVSGVKFNSEIEQLQTSFEVMTGSSEKAKETIEKLKKVGASTPYELKGLAKTTQTLMQYGFTADEAYEATINLGDIAQGSAEKMDSIALAYGQMSSLGKVTMQDIKQMINAGFNPLQAIADMTGETLGEVNKRYEEGKISVEEVTQAMKYASSENGKYYKSMEKQSKTLSGQISTLKDNFQMLTGTLAEGLSKTLAGQVLPLINELLENLQKAFEEGGITKFIEVLGTSIADMVTKIAEEIPKFIELAGMIISSLITGIQNNLSQIVSAAASIITTFTMTILDLSPQIFDLGLELIVQLTNAIAENIDEIIPKLVQTMMDLFLKLEDPENLDKLTDAAVKLVLALIKGIINSIPELVSNTDFLLKAMLNILSGGKSLIIKIGWSLIKSFIDAIIEKIFGVKDASQKIINKIKEVLKDLPNKAKQWGKDFVQGLINGITGMLGNVGSAVKGLANKIKSFLHFSRPDEGPLREYETWMPDFIKGLAKGIDQSSYLVEDATQNLADTMANTLSIDSMVGDVDAAMRGLNSKVSKSINPTINPNVAFEINYKLMAKAVKEALEDMDVVLDDDKVGKFVTKTITEEIYS